MLWANNEIDANQHISLLAAAILQVTITMSNMNDQQLLDFVEYDQTASVLRQCDKPNSSLGTNTSRANDSNFRQNTRRRS